MATCANCGATLTCGCQKRTTSDGKSACSNCINKIQKTTTPTTTAAKPAETKSAIPQTWGPDRYKNLHKFIKK